MIHKANPGDRVIAVLSATKTNVVLFGAGTYRGDNPCPLLAVTDEQISQLVETMQEDGFTEDEIVRIRSLYSTPRKNPEILLDNGHTVWGCESWWGPEDEILNWMEGKTITYVPESYFEMRDSNKPFGEVAQLERVTVS